jgi:hypothetical protein
VYTPCVELDEKRARTPTVTGGSVTARARPPAAAQYPGYILTHSTEL